MPYMATTVPMSCSFWPSESLPATVQPVTACGAADVNAASRARRRVAAGTAVAPRFVGSAASQKGQLDSNDRTWREHEGQGTRTLMGISERGPTRPKD